MPRRSGEAKPLEEEQPPRQLLIPVLSTGKVRQANQHVRKRLVIWEKENGRQESAFLKSCKTFAVVGRARVNPMQRWSCHAFLPEIQQPSEHYE